MKQISFTEAPELVADGIGGANADPKSVAKKLGWIHEQSFDGLDYFDFVGIDVGNFCVGFYRHRGAPPNLSVVTARGASRDQVREFVERSLGVDWLEQVQY